MPNEMTLSIPDHVAPVSRHIQGIIPTDYDSLWRLAKATCLGGLAPRFNNEPARVSAVMMCGMELGLKPMASLRLMYQTPDGQPALMVRGMLAVAQASGLLVYWADRIEGEGDGRTATVVVERRGLPRMTRSFSAGEARRAGLFGKRGDMYAKWTDRMLFSRAASFALNDLFADLLGGFYDPSEIGGPVTDEQGCEMLPPADLPEPSPPPEIPAAAAPQDRPADAVESVPAPAPHDPPPAPCKPAVPFWERDTLAVCKPTAAVEMLIDRLLNAAPKAPSIELLDRLFAEQPEALLAEAMANDDYWPGVENARRARWQALMMEAPGAEAAG